MKTDTPEKVTSLLAQIAECNSQRGELDTKRAALEAQHADILKTANGEDQKELRKLVEVELVLRLWPNRVAPVEVRRKALMEELRPHEAALRGELTAKLDEAEQSLVARFKELLAPICAPDMSPEEISAAFGMTVESPLCESVNRLWPLTNDGRFLMRYRGPGLPAFSGFDAAGLLTAADELENFLGNAQRVSSPSR